MSDFHLVGDSPPRTPPLWLPAIGGLLAAGIVTTLVYQQPPLHSLSTTSLIGLAVERILGVVLANAVTVLGLYAISHRTVRADARPLMLETSLNALWLAPLALLVRQNSPWAMVITAVLVAGVVKSVRLGRAPALADVHESRTLNHPFSLLESSPGFWWQVSAAAAALCAQAGAFTSLAGYPLKAALLVAISSAVWTWSYTRNYDRKLATSSPSSSRSLLIICLAFVFTTAGLLPYLRLTYGVRGLGIPSFAHYSPSAGDRAGQEGRPKTPQGSIAPPAEGDPGVVLLPVKQTHTKLVAPAPIIANALLKGQRSTKPLEIPFEGVYWFFRAPDDHPPRSSLQAHGSPEALDIRSTDRRPLSMEAREDLGSTINLDCCSRIQVAIRNADRYPQTVTLELVLINSTAPGKPSQSLGRTMVASTRPWKLYDKPASPANETLNFVLPAKSSLRRFDEVKIVFRMNAARADTGPKIAIDRLVLIPRGL